MMKKLYTLFTVVMLFSVLSAAYLEKIPMSITQPDGTTFECYASGDEFFNYLHDENNFTIIQSDVDGFYYYGIKEGDNVVPSEFLVNSVNPADTYLTPNAKISEREYLRRKEAKFSQVRDQTRVSSTGVINNLVVYIRFNDQEEFSEPRSYFDNKFNNTNPNAESMYNYYKEVSYNSLEIFSTHYPPVEDMSTNLSYQDEHPRSYYLPYNAVTNPNGYNDSNRADREHTLLQNAVNYIADMVPENLNIDNDNDGYVDNVCFIIEGNNGAWADLLWAHRWYLFSRNVYIHGKRVYDYTFQPVSQNGVYTLCHEMFHAIGAPDLYHYNSDGLSPYGYWDLMSSSFTHMSAYMKYRYSDWIDEIPEISASGTYWLHPLTSPTNNCYKVQAPNSSTEFYVIEFRKKIPNTYENNIPASGITISRVNTLYDGQGNASGPPDEIYLYRPNGTTSTNGDILNANFSAETGRTSFSSITNPTPFLSNGQDGGLIIDNISSANADSISFTLFPGSALLMGLVSSEYPIEDFSTVDLQVGNMIFHPSENGYYSQEVTQGAHTLTARLDGFAEFAEDLIIDGEGVHEVNITLEVLDIPMNLSSEVNDGVTTINWDFDMNSNPTFTNFSIFVSMNNETFYNIGQSYTTTFSHSFNNHNELWFQIVANYGSLHSFPSETLYINYNIPVSDEEQSLLKTQILGNYPNPFNPTTTISYSLAHPEKVNLEVYNLIGQKVKTLVSENQSAGNHDVVWNGENENGNIVPSGIYFYKLKAGRYTSTKKMILLK